MFEEYWQSRKWSRATQTIAYAAPAVLFVALFIAYKVAPRFYFDYLLEHENREYQFVELSTFVFAFLAAAVLAWAAVSLWRITTRARRTGLAPIRSGPLSAGDGRGSALIVAVIALATFFLAMEEINWGQTLRRWGTPSKAKADDESQARLKATATNLHNNIHYIQGLGSLFMVASLWGLPAIWAMRRKISVVPRDWAPAVPEGAVVVALIVAFIPAQWKVLYSQTVPDYAHRKFFIEYLEEIKEQKEMFMALTLLIYSLYRVSAVDTLSRLVAAKASAGATAGAALNNESRKSLTP